MRAIGWILFAIAAAALTVYAAALMSNPTLVDPGEQVQQVRDYKAVAASVDEKRLQGTVERLAALKSRVTGYPGTREAADRLVAAFNDIGLTDVHEEQFVVASPIDRGAELRVEGRAEALHCLWPNLVRTPTLPTEGIEGPLIYAGTAKPSEFNGKPVEGSIVLLEFDCQTDWLNAFLLGAKAVVFIEPETPKRAQAEAKFLTVPADTPRFWIGRSEGMRLVERLRTAATPPQAKLNARMDWVNAEAWNIVGSVPGTAEDAAKGVVVISAYYDSMSVVPAASPGAEQACSAAALLELARTLKAHPLQRRAVFVATAGHGQAMAGVRHFLRTNALPDAAGNPPRLDVAAFVALDLSSHSRRLGLFYKAHYIDEDERIQPWFSHLGKSWKRWATEACAALQREPDSAFADCINSGQGKNWRTHLPGRFAFEGELATLAGFVGLTFATTDDARLAIDSPLDTPDRVDFAALGHQVRLLCCVVPNFFNTAGAFIRKPPDNYWTRLDTRAVEFNFQKDYLPNEPLPGALVMVQGTTPNKSLCGVRGEPVLLTGEDGRASFDGLPERRAVGWWRGTVTVGAFCLDKEAGIVTYAPDLGPEGARNYPLAVDMNAPTKEATIVCFPARALTFYDLADQRYYVPFDTIQVLDAGTNSSPINYGYLLPRNPPWLSATETCAVVFAKPGTRLRILMGAGPIGKRLLLLNSTPEAPLGTGFLVGAFNPPPSQGGDGGGLRPGQIPDLHPHPALSLGGRGGSSIPFTPLRAARDMWQLDEQRASEFRSHGLENPRVTRLHADAARRLAEAEKALEARDYATFLARSRAAWALEARIYPEVLGTANDVVKGLIFYLILVLPFAFFVERLLISARGIIGRILGTTGAFVAVFLLLAVFHPAFRVAISPLMILLAFIVLTLSSLVITLVVRRFEELMAERRAAVSGAHAADVSRLSAALTAFFLGIGHLRKRPIRTTLTAVTIVLLAFSVLSLAAVVQYLKQTVVPYRGVEARYDGLLLRGRQWQAISLVGLDALANEFGGDVVPRAWYYSAMVGDQSFVALTGGPASPPSQGGDGGGLGAEPGTRPSPRPSLEGRGVRTIYATALVGLTAREKQVTGPDQALVAGRWLDENQPEAILPEEMAKALGMSPEKAIGTTVECFGRPLRVVGVLDSKKMAEIKDLDGEPITPVDYMRMAQKRRDQGPPDSDVIEEYLHLAAENVAIVPYRFLIDVGGELRSVVVRGADKAEVTTRLRELMPRTELTLFAGRGGQTDLFSTRGTSTITGAGSLLVPTLLAALIVFNTMLGSIYERTKEIGILSSIGLAPKHIGALFLAESIVHAVVGIVLGYLLGQGVSRIVHAYGLLPGLQLNYSSSATVLLSIFIMVVVVGSSIYPALQARRIAAPALEARWHLPEAVDDVMAIEMPFTVSHETALGMSAYLQEYFEAHTEAALGGFAAEDIAMTRTASGITLAMTAWLAPFDVGVSQRVEVETFLLPEGDFYGIEMRLRRQSGDESSWRRLNRHFTDLIRKQFLIWRVLRAEARTAYFDRVAGWFEEGVPRAACRVEEKEKNVPREE